MAIIPGCVDYSVCHKKEEQNTSIITAIITIAIITFLCLVLIYVTTPLCIDILFELVIMAAIVMITAIIVQITRCMMIKKRKIKYESYQTEDQR